MVFAFGHQKRGRQADSARKAVKFLRETKGVPRDPRTKLGRDILSASQTVQSARKKLRGK